MRFYLLTITLLLGLPFRTQVDPVQVGTIPGIITESSGLECHQGECWTFNDSDDGGRLYHLDETGLFLQQLIIENADHIDYEDVARADDGRYFIGDFGNNDNEREDLTIYILPDLDTISGTVVSAQTIAFTLEDQVDFPPDDSQRNFDIEGMIHLGDSLLLFTRNRTEPYDGITKIYRLYDTAGVQVAQVIGSYLGNLSEIYNSITAADISPDGGRIALTTSGSMFLFTDVTSGINIDEVQYNFYSTTRSYEGLSFVDDCTVLLSEEASSAGLYALNTCEIVTSLNGHSVPYSPVSFTIRDGHLLWDEHIALDFVQILDGLGRQISLGKPVSPYPLPNLASSMIHVRFRIGQQVYSARFVLDH